MDKKENENNFADFIETLWGTITAIINETYVTVEENRRIANLACHHKKERVRKKNLHRLMKIHKRRIKNG